MKIEVKDLAAFIGIEVGEETTIDQIKASFNEKYVPTETHSQTVGALNNQAIAAIKKSFKDIGIEVDPTEIKGKPLLEIPSVFATAAKTKFDEYESAKGATTEQIEAKFKTDMEKLKTQIAEKDGLLNDVKTQFQTFQTEVVTKERKGKIDGEFGKVIGSLKFSESIHPLAQEGFKASLTKEYQFDLSDEGKPIVKNADGNLVKSKVKAGEFATYEEVIAEKFAESKLGQVVDPKKAATFVPIVAASTPPNGGRPVAAPHIG